MPNWCNNYLELEHEDPAMIERAQKAFADAKLLEEFCPVWRLCGLRARRAKRNLGSRDIHK